jgi:hypothetical protein
MLVNNVEDPVWVFVGNAIRPRKRPRGRGEDEEKVVSSVEHEERGQRIVVEVGEREDGGGFQ